MPNLKWYLSTWFISLCFAFSFIGIPFIAGIVLLILRLIEDKKIKKFYIESGIEDVIKLKTIKENLEIETGELLLRRNELKNEVIVLDDATLLQSFGFYDPNIVLKTRSNIKIS